MVAVVIVAAVTVVLFVGAFVAVASWAVSAHILIEANFGLFSIDILVGGRDHLVNPLWRLTIEFGAKVTVMESSNEGSDDFYFRDVGNRISHLEKSPNVATEELR